MNEKEDAIYFFFLDDLLATYLSPSFSSSWSPGFVRLTRDGDFTMDFQDTDPESIPDVMMTRLGTREKGRPIRLQYEGDFPQGFLHKAQVVLKLSRHELFPAPTSLCLQGLWAVVNQVPDHIANKKDNSIRYPALQSKVPEPFNNPVNIFEKLRERDYLLHHPYDSFDAFVEWMRAAAEDKEVIRIEQTVYRMDAVSPSLIF